MRSIVPAGIFRQLGIGIVNGVMRVLAQIIHRHGFAGIRNRAAFRAIRRAVLVQRIASMRARRIDRYFFVAVKAREIKQRSAGVSIAVPGMALFTFAVTQFNRLQRFTAGGAEKLPAEVLFHEKMLFRINACVALIKDLANLQQRVRAARAAEHREGYDIGAEAFGKGVQGFPLLVGKAGQRVIVVVFRGSGGFFRLSLVHFVFRGRSGFGFLLRFGLGFASRRGFKRVVNRINDRRDCRLDG